MLTREQILAVSDIQIETVTVPEWGGDVCVRSITGTERDWLEMNIYSERTKGKEVNMKNFRAKLLSLCLCDEKGDSLFTEKDVEALAKKSASALQRTFTVAQRLSGLSNDEADDILKNSSGEASGDSASG